MKKQCNSSIIKNHKITFPPHGIPLNGYVASLVILRFRTRNKNKHCENIQ